MKPLMALVFAAFLTGCVSTKMTGIVDPAYQKTGYQISKVVVRTKGATLEEMLNAEFKLAKEFGKYNIEAIKFTDIAPPTRNFTAAQEAKLLTDSGADSVFNVYVAGRDVVEGYVPQTVIPGRTTSYVSQIGGTAMVNTYTTAPIVSGGYSTSEPVMSTLVTLVDLSNGNNVWKAEGITTGNDASSFLELLINAGESAILDLEQKGLLPAKAETVKN